MLYLSENLRKYPHTRESREVIQPLICKGLTESEMNEHIRNILIGDGKGIW